MQTALNTRTAPCGGAMFIPVSHRVRASSSSHICAAAPTHALLTTQHRQQALRASRSQSQADRRCVHVRSSEADTATTQVKEDLTELNLKIEGMTCEKCISIVTDTLQEQEGVESAKVSLEQGLATVQLKAGNQAEAFDIVPKLVDAVTVAGYSAQSDFGQDNI